MNIPIRLPESWIKKVQNKQYFDEDLKPDSLNLLEAAAALEVREFKLFELAYKDWYGKRPLAHVVEAHFSNYMFNKVIPAWVRSFSRRIVDLHNAGDLDPKSFGVYQPLPSKRLIFVGRVFATTLILVFVGLLILVSKEPPTTPSLFGRADLTEVLDRPQHNAMP